MTKGELIGRIANFLRKVNCDIGKTWVTYRFLLYLVKQNVITENEAENIQRFHSNRTNKANDIIYFKLIEELYNKHIHDKK